MNKLHKAVCDYLSLRRAVGYRLEREGSWLPDFVSFLERSGSEFITTKLALEWATRSPRASTESKAKCLAMVRGLAKYVRADDPRTEIPAADLLPRHNYRNTPYVYSQSEVEELIRACGKLNSLLMRHTYATLVGLLAVTGMRLGEAINLDRSDIDDDEQVITICKGKLGKSRELPVHATTIQALRDYSKKRDRVFGHPKTASFFLSQTGNRLLPQNVWKTFDTIRCATGLQSRRPKPRIHDLRHTFVVRTLMRWYAEEGDVGRRLAQLSTYMGHVNPSSTYWYLTGTPDLMALAVKRLEKYLGDLR